MAGAGSSRRGGYMAGGGVAVPVHRARDGIAIPVESRNFDYAHFRQSARFAVSPAPAAIHFSVGS